MTVDYGIKPILSKMEKTTTVASTTTTTYSDSSVTYNSTTQEYGGVGYDVGSNPKPIFDTIDNVRPKISRVGNL